MAFITLQGTLLDPNGLASAGDELRFTHKSTTGSTLKSAVTLLKLTTRGNYYIDLQYGLVLVEYKDKKNNQFENLGVATVNATNPATTIPELLNALTPVSSAELIEFQSILADCVTAQNAASTSAAAALVSENAAAASAATLDLINDLSQPYIFDTVAFMQSSVITFPVGKIFLTSDSDSALYRVEVAGPNDQIDSFLLSTGGYANRLSSVAGDQFYSYKQRHMLAEQLKKLRDKQVITFTWYGDSNSVRNAKGVQTTFRGTLQGAYGAAYINNVIDRATSGFSAKTAFETYTTDHAGHISIINYGTNDASTQDGYPLLNNIQKYLYWMEKLIIRELNFGHPCVLVTPLPTRFDKAWETTSGYDSPSDLYPTVKRIDSYQMGEALKYLGAKYSIPVIDSVESMSSYKDEMFYNPSQSINVGTPFGDVVHLASGYSEAWGAKIAAIFIGDMVLNAPSVSDGDMLTVTHGTSPVIVNSSRVPDAVYTYYPDSAEAAFASGDNIVGNRCLTITSSERVTFSFYASSDNLIVIPTLMLFANTNILVFLDGRVVQPSIKIDNSVTGTSLAQHEFTKITTTNTVVNRPKGYATLLGREESNESLWIPDKGWHTVTILCNAGNVAVSGLNIWSASHDLLASEINGIKSAYLGTYTAGAMIDAINGVMLYAFSSVTDHPSTSTGGTFIKYESEAGTVGVINYSSSAGLAGTAWIKHKISSVWGAWTQT